MSDSHKPEDSPALTFRSHHYPERYQNRVPRRVRMTETVTPDWPLNFLASNLGLVARRGCEYPCFVNSHGAVSAIIDGRALGLKPDEFDVVEWWEER
jgi:hypothetical protein